VKNSIVLHHTADSSGAPQYNKVWAYHNNGAGGRWPKGAGISYHFMIERDGSVLSGRPEDSIGWHAGTYYWNLRSIGICLAGDFTKESPTKEQLVSLAKLLTEVQNRWGIPDDRIFLHREVRNTSCPGTNLRELAFQERDSLLRLRVANLQNALRHVKGPRKTLIERLLLRLSRQGKDFGELAIL
jgi:N-acetyl-anhydromuramyl-L-alanine amidase AmpD